MAFRAQLVRPVFAGSLFSLWSRGPNSSKPAMTVTTSASPPPRLSLKKERFVSVGLGAIVFAYFFPKQSLFYVLCGIYDVSRHRPLTGFVLRQ